MKARSTGNPPVGEHGGHVDVGILPFMFRSSMLLLAGLLSVAIALCRATPHATQPDALPRISQRQTPTLERVFVDSFNRQRIFHGTNAVVKGPPWIPDVTEFSQDISLTDEDFQLMKRLGLSVVRLGVMWAGVEPVQRGHYNESYLDVVEDIVTRGAKYGIYFLLDMHQDSMHEFFCGEGLPTWAVKSDGLKNYFGKFPEPLAKPYVEKDANNFPVRSDCNRYKWAVYYATESQSSAWQALWENIDGIADAWGDMLAHVALRFKNVSSVLGIEMINEPYAGDIYHYPGIAIPLKPYSADYKNMQSAYDLVSKKINEADENRLIFFAGLPWDDFGSGFDHAPSHNPAKSVLAYHYYCCGDGPQFPNSSKFQIEVQRNVARKLNTGTMMTETFAPDQFDQFYLKNGVADNCDRFLQSWATWEWKTFCRESNESVHGKSQWAEYGSCKTGYGVPWNVTTNRPFKAKYLARTHARAVSGNITSMKFDAQTGKFELRYELDLTIKMPSEIFMSTEYYYHRESNISSGTNSNPFLSPAPIIQIHPEACVRADFDENDNMLYVSASNEESCAHMHGVEVTINIT